MCGIAGIVGEIDAELAAQMSRMLMHRGPDGDGTYVDERAGVVLAHRRLAILDLSRAARQPMTSRDARWTITFNGEIFNYIELREELSGPWRSASDTEVLVEACAKWGLEKTLARVNGMFAFALWDSQQRTLYLARDRVGEKPLVYYSDAHRLAFASEIKALAELAGRRLDPAAVELFLALGYVPAPMAIFRRCRKLEPGHYLKWRAGRSEVRRYWFPEKTVGARERVALRPLIADAVRVRLRSDVPVALYLSGGVDSSIVAAESGPSIEAFTVAFEENQTDLAYARRVARHLGLQHHVVEVGGRSLLEQLDSILWHYDEPFADSSLVPAYALARAIGGKYKVVLNGDGGDEAFAGYRHYEHIRTKQIVKAAAARAGVLDGRAGDATQVYLQSKSVFRREERIGLMGAQSNGDHLSQFIDADAFLRCAPADSALKRALWCDRHLYLPNDLTYKMDIALMAAGIEGRAAFLDHRVLEAAQSLPEGDLVRNRQKKIALREAYRGILPDAVLDRPKLGFGAPIGRWLREGLRRTAQDFLPCALLERQPQTGASGMRLWTLLLFALWARAWRATW
jgi:asparagine synthase (glutamine-hydrolysing)